MTTDPFATLAKTDAPDESATTATAVEEKPLDDASYFAAEMTLGEEDFEQPEEQEFDEPYVLPENNSWVPLEITSAQVGTRDMRVVVGEEGQESIEEVTLERFELELEHMADCYGTRRRPYLLGTPVWDVTIPYKKPRRTRGGGQKLGFEKTSGRKLVAATRVTKPGQAITSDILPELAEEMHGKVVMAKIRHRDKEYTDSEPMKKADGSFVKCKVDKHGTQIKVLEDGSGNLTLEDGAPFMGNKATLIPNNGSYLIPDDSEDGAIVKEIKTRIVTFDNLYDDVAPVPSTVMESPSEDITRHFTCHKMAGGRVAVERYARVTRLDNSEVDAQVTWNTVGKMTTKPVKAGAQVSAVIPATGELIRISWIGTNWSEVPNESGLDEFKGD